MEFGLDTSLAILAFFIVIGPLIFIHELGHFLVARFFDIEVEEFGIGYPPRMVTLFERGGTKFTLNWIPLGGFMRPIGEDDPNVDGGLASANKRARFSVLAAGPVANFIAAFVLLIAMFMIGAPQADPGAQVNLVVPDGPAEQAGLQVDDIILQADDLVINQYDDLTTYIFDKIGEEIVFLVQRGDDTLELTMRPRTSWPDGQGPTGIVIQPVVTTQQFGIVAATGKALEEIGMLMRAFVEIPAMVIQQQIPARFLRPVSVIGISQLGGQAIDDSIQEAALWPIIRLTAYISIALAVTNLLPIPALDGGRILFVVIEAIRGKRIDPEREMIIHFIGFAVLMTAMVIFVYLDIVNPLIP